MTKEGRRRFLQVTAFVLGLAVFDVALGGLLGALRSSADPRSSPIGLLEAASRDGDAAVVVLGSSRANHHMNSSLLSDRLGRHVHNAGLDGQSVIFARAVQEFIWSQGVRPELFVLQIEAFDVIAYEPARALVAAHFLDEMPATRETLEREGYNVKVKLLSRTFRFNSLVVQLVLNRVHQRPDPSEDSFEAMSGSLEGSLRRVSGVPGPWKGPSRTVSADALRVLRQFVRATTDEGSTAILVTGPYLRGGPVPVEELTALDSIAAVAESEGGIFLRIDERSYPVFDDPALFVDPSHLNAAGAEVYSDLLAELIRALPHVLGP